MTTTLSISWTFQSALSLVEAVRTLEPHFRAWFGRESDLTELQYSLFTDTDETFQNQADYAPLLPIIDGQPRHVILHLSGRNREAGVTAADIWLSRHTSTHPISVTVKITGTDIAVVATLRDRSRQRLASTVEEALGVTPKVGPDAGSLTGGGALSASPEVTASIFDEVDQSQRIGSPRPARVFLSYSHDSEEHRQWVARLANRLNSLGIWLIFDQWDLGLGGDLPRFMESGITAADRVIIVCTEQYNRKANGGHGGAGYEKMIMTADLMRDQTSSRLVPVVRGSQSPSTPTFLRSRLYVDFTDDGLFETRLTELSRALLTTGSQRPPYSPPASAAL